MTLIKVLSEWVFPMAMGVISSIVASAMSDAVLWQASWWYWFLPISITFSIVYATGRAVGRKEATA